MAVYLLVVSFFIIYFNTFCCVVCFSKKCGTARIDADDDEDLGGIAAGDDTEAANSEVMQITGADGGSFVDENEDFNTSAMSIESVRISYCFSFFGFVSRH